MSFAPALPAPALDLAELVNTYAHKSRAENTLRAYRGQWAGFERWCESHGRIRLPAEPRTVAAYLASRAKAGATLATINQALAAIVFAHKAAGAAFSRDHRELNLVMAGIRREHVRPQRQAKPLTAALVRDVLAGLGTELMELRDGALLSALYTFALRPSEAAALDWMQHGNGRGWLAMHANELELVLLGSKASPGQIERVVLPVRGSERTARMLRCWTLKADISRGEPLFRALVRNGVCERRLHSGSIGVIVRRALVRHFVERGQPLLQARTIAQGYSGHSGRIGFYTSASAAGAAPQHIAAVARHKGLGMARRYTMQTDLVACAPHRHKRIGV